MSMRGVSSTFGRPSSRETNEDDAALRAALLSIELMTRVETGQTGVFRQQVSPDDAVRTIARSRSRFQHRALALAVANLAVPVVLQQQALVKGNAKNAGATPISYANTLLTKLVPAPVAASIRTIPTGDVDGIMASAYDLAWASGKQGVGASSSGTEGCGAHYDPTSMITTVTAFKTNRGDMRTLPAFIDPRGWSRQSLFWLASDRVGLEDGRFVPYPDEAPIGTPWKGYLYEFVVLNQNNCTESGFQNYLCIDFDVQKDPASGVPTCVCLLFSLYQAAGSLQLTRVTPGGMQIDVGYSKTDVTLPSGSVATVKLTSSKTVRYSDIVSRSTRGQGVAGAGNVLNMNAPAILALWMKDLVYGNLKQWSVESGF